MRVADKIKMERDGLVKEGPITIVALGDSVTHGAVGHEEIDYETVYWNRLRQKLNQVNNYIPVNVINAGIGGGTATEALGRMEKQVFRYHPDLVIVCFGLNDVNGTLESYVSAMRTIFDRCNEEKLEAILLTPNMLNTYVAQDTAPIFLDYAIKTAEYQNSGRMDLFVDAAKKVAREKGVDVCDCYAKWKEISQIQDVTMLLANRINHPTREMHELFAQNLLEIILQ